MSKHIAKINKVPYLLWFNHSTIVEADWKREQIWNDFGTKSKIQKVNKWLIFLLKYVPLFLLLLIGGVAPENTQDYGFFTLGGMIAFLSIWVFMKYPNWIKLYIIAICGMGVWFLTKSEIHGIHGIAYYIDRVFMFGTEALFLGYIVYEILTGKWDKYYFLRHVWSDITLKTERKSKPLLKIGNREILNIKTGVDYVATARAGGFFAMIDKDEEILEGEENEEDNH
ncbi:MAG: hypothetical protein PHX44_08185 [Sulfurimonas sp.]|uniref:hypothetical protein n=1 Tax=Sulfurimonas sp. TaxID=2022749 RepID=UPI00260163EC|nr:hypothetical protein [Sulfurimonas sp.]MDD2653012.1 hypothetical protein [Sulfurimonas sp.]MDD3452458.1 hypothetical protein [Sulfurimonas sp.]